MPETEKILEQFALLAGISQEDALAYTALAEAAAAQVCRQLRTGLTPKKLAEEKEVLAYLCGVLCFYRCCLAKSGEESIRVLDTAVSRKESGSLARAERLREDALSLAADLLADRDFSFVRA